MDPCEPSLYTITGPDVASNYDYILHADSLSIPFYDFAYVKSTFACSLKYVTVIPPTLTSVMTWTLDGTVGGNFVIQTTDKAFASSGMNGVHDVTIDAQSAKDVSLSATPFAFTVTVKDPCESPLITLVNPTFTTPSYILDASSETTALSLFTVSNTALTCTLTYEATIPTVSVAGSLTSAITFDTATNQFTFAGTDSELAGTFDIVLTASTPDGTALTA